MDLTSQGPTHRHAVQAHLHRSIWALAASGFLLAASPTLVRSAERPPPASLLYLTEADWIAASRPDKVKLVNDFMRVFCGDRLMSAESFVDCLDRTPSRTGSLFTQALVCVARHSR